MFAKVPDCVTVVDTWQRYPDINLVNLMNVSTSQAFILPISSKATDQEFRSQVAAVIGGEPTELGIVDSHGKPWRYPSGYNAGEVVYVNRVGRGGMRMPSSRSSRSRSVSPTRPFTGAGSSHQAHPQPQQQQDQSIVPMESITPAHLPEDVQQRVQQNTMSVRPPAEEGDDSPSTGSSDDTERLHAYVDEIEPTSAQPRNISREVYEANQYIGRIRAPPNALVREVLADVESRILPHRPMVPIPYTAELWLDLTAIQIPARPMLDTIQPMDMRTGRWEVFQTPRHVAVITPSGIQSVAVFPSSISMRSAQIRLNNMMHDYTYYHLSATAYDTWVITIRRLPEEIREMLLELEELRTIVGRGGMHVASRLGEVPVAHVFAHMPWCMVTAYYSHQISELET